MSALTETPQAPATAPAAQTFPPLKLREKAVYATGDIVEGTLNIGLSTFFLFYLTGVCGLTGSLAGLALFVTLMVDAVLDPLIGYTSDNTRSRLGRRHPYLLGAALPLAVTFALLYTLPPGLKGWGLFAYVVVLLLVQRVVHSGFLLPYAALGSELSRDYKERSSVSAFRSLFNSLGAIVALGLGFGVFLNGEQAILDRGAYAAYGWSLAAVVLTLMLVCALGTLPMRGRLQVSLHTAKPTPASFVRELGEAARNRTFLILFGAIVIFWIAQGAAGSLSLHAYKYFWGAPAEFLATIPIFTIAGALTGVPLSALALRYVQKHQVCVGGVVLYCVNQFAPATLKIMGVIPEAGPVLYAVLAVAVVLQYWALAAIGVSFFSMMADCTDEHEHLFGARREGLFFAGTMFSTKASIALGTLIAGIGLDLIGFPKEVAKLGPNPVIAADTVRNLGILVGPGAAAIAVACIVILSRYSLDGRRVAAIQAELARRRATANAPS